MGFSWTWLGARLPRLVNTDFHVMDDDSKNDALQEQGHSSPVAASLTSSPQDLWHARVDSILPPFETAAAEMGKAKIDQEVGRVAQEAKSSEPMRQPTFAMINTNNLSNKDLR